MIGAAVAIVLAAAAENGTAVAVVRAAAVMIGTAVTLVAHHLALLPNLFSLVAQGLVCIAASLGQRHVYGLPVSDLVWSLDLGERVLLLPFPRFAFALAAAT